MGLEPGDKIELELVDTALVLTPHRNSPPDSWPPPTK
ncbi:hypothetical protein [Pseudomonas sediminis]